MSHFGNAPVPKLKELGSFDITQILCCQSQTLREATGHDFHAVNLGSDACPTWPDSRGR
jgi:hypothetical protein